LLPTSSKRNAYAHGTAHTSGMLLPQGG
jgi:hypothetical protein